jgi:hypothetical protein
MASRNFFAYLLALFFVAATLVGCGGGSRPITISGTLPATGTVGVAYSGSLTAAGGNNDYTWTVSGLPAGVTASNTTSATVTVSGTPTAAGTAAVTYSVRDTKGRIQSGSASIVISAPTVAISGTLAATGTVGTAYTGSLTASGGTGPYTWTVTGLPTGITYSGASTATLTFAGTPGAAGTSNVVVMVADSSSPANTATYNVSIVVSAAAGITITGTLPATGTVGTAYTGTLTASGGSGSYTWSVTNLPDGTKVSDPTQPAITVSGTPKTAATYAFTAKVTDSLGATTNYNVHIVISGGTTTAACSSSPAARGNEASFNKPYAFILSGYNDEDPSVFGGSVTPDGAGNITAGAIDTVQEGSYSQYTVNAAGSTYSFGSDGRGCLALSISQVQNANKKTPIHNAVPKNAKAFHNSKLANSAKSRKHGFASQQDSTPITVVYSISISSAYGVGRIEEFDYDTYAIIASGQMHQQDPTNFTLGSLGPHFVFGAGGYVTVGDGGIARAAMAAAITNTTGVTTSASADVNEAGLISPQLTGGTGTLSAVDATTGRGTGTYTINYLGSTLTFDFAYYVINGSDFYAVTTDDLADEGSLALTGRALGGSTSTPALNGYYMLGATGLDADSGGNTATIGTFQAPSANNIANATLYTNDAGSYPGPQTYATATYTLDPPTGRAVVSGVSDNPPIAYLTNGDTDDGIAGFIVGTGSDTESGFLFEQTEGTPAFNNSSTLAGGYAYGTADDVNGSNGSQVGVFNFSSDDYTSTFDLVAPFVDGVDPLQPNQTGSGTFNVNADGSGTLSGSNIAFVTNGTVLFGIDTTSAQPLLYVAISQTQPE